ncbi:filamentous hemagglutinin N-terminal domain-containing protein [Alkalilimnicola sp. S0819]|uniref:two-partner secretion domain-containing protein n=1 Tax=Alkalilimnicola sp. S0819 TaxID=2613922 RepID=UPI001261CE0E|nr:filamentous hemagglutinin N-terminal domain-containing protein [Alkalilimnicola sp. S0819]KAB7627956.1 filamentous hemagglutinin N-terminal domain-containing protein [Alkalilimnicola sp. S0819]MPQ15406.1 filamentous hemagglutinin N-terminal domain-containing protein [Alkalilimnicola sp. S0819]
MNRIYRPVWNAARRSWQVAGEIGRRRGKSAGAGRAPRRLLAASGLLLAVPAFGADLPSGGTVVAGEGGIHGHGDTLTVEQRSQNLVLDWQSFSVGEGHTVRFHQPNARAAALNRVTGDQVSRIRGALRANGRVFLVNPNGVMFSASAQVDVGSLVASTLAISTEDFMAGNYRFEGASANAVINQGNITAAEGGVVAMIAAEIINTGSIHTPGGSTLMGAGSKVTLDLGGPVKIQVEEALLDTYIEQGGAIRADGGLVYLTARAAGDLASSVINHSGVTEARTLASGENGRIMLMGDMAGGELQVAGTLDASAPTGGDGGFIETSAARVRIDEVKVSTQARDGATGEWLIDPVDITIAASGGNVTGADLAAALETTNVTLDTSASGSCTGVTCSALGGSNGDIFVNDSIQVSAGNTDNTLTLKANRNIIVDEGVEISSSSGKLNTVFWADQDATDGGMIWLKDGATVRTNGGHLWLGGGSGSASWNGLTVGDGEATGNAFNSNGIILLGTTLETAGGHMAFLGRGRSGTSTSTSTPYPSPAPDTFLNSNGIRLESGNTIDAGTGTLYFYGYTDALPGGGALPGAGSANGVEFSSEVADRLLSASAAEQAILIEGYAENNATADNSWGFYSWLAQIESTGGGGIHIKGSGAKNAGVTIASGAHVLADAGRITLEGLGSGSGKHDVLIQGTVGQKAATAVTASSSDIEIIGDSLNVSGTLASSGELAIRIRSANRKINIGGSDATALEIAGGYFGSNFADGFAGITIGDSNSDTITVGGVVNYRDDLVLKSGTSVVVDSVGSLTGAAGQNASLTLWSRADGNLAATDWKRGSVWLKEGSAVNTNGGDITIGGGTDPLLGYGLGDNRVKGLGENNAIFRGASVNGTLNAAGGDISIRGKGYAGGNSARGVSVGGDISTQGAGSISIHGQAAAWSDAVAIGDTALADDPGSVVAGTGTVHLAGQRSWGKAINVNSGSRITGDGLVVLDGLGGQISATGSNYLTAPSLLVRNSNSASLNSAQNDFDTLVATQVGNFTLVDQDALAIGAISWDGSNYKGVQATGSVDVATLSGDLSVNEDVHTSSANSVALTLNAGLNEAAGVGNGGDIKINGASVDAVGGTRLYTGSLAGSTGLVALLGSGSGRFRYNSDEVASNYTAALGGGRYAMFREQPLLSVSPEAAGMVYGGAQPDYTAVYGGLVNGDSAPLASGTATWTTAAGGTSAGGHRVVGSYDVAYNGGLVSGLGYGFTDDAASLAELTVSKRSLGLSLRGTSERVYDGSTAIGFSGYTVSANGMLAGDDLTVATGNLTGFVDRNVGSNKVVTFTGFGLSGADTGNYQLVSGAAHSNASITPRPVTVTADAQRKLAGEPDPVLSYRTDCGALQADCGLVAGERLQGALSRQAGRAAGVYRILRGTVNGAHNPNYQITYVGADLVVAPGTEPGREAATGAVQQEAGKLTGVTDFQPPAERAAPTMSAGLEVVELRGEEAPRGAAPQAGEQHSQGPLRLFVVDGGIRRDASNQE